MASTSDRPHPMSLLPMSAHAPELIELVRMRQTADMVRHIAARTRAVIQVQDDEPSPVLPTPPTTPLKAEFGPLPTQLRLPSLEDFIVHVVQQSNVQVPTLLTTLIYLDRLRAKLPSMAKGAFPFSRALVVAYLSVFS
jgi:G1/S-specific cyclin PLC1